MTNTTRKAVLAAAFVLVGLGNWARADNGRLDTGIPSEIAKEPKELWRRVMNMFYGRHDPKRKCWESNSQDKNFQSNCLSPYLLKTVPSGEGTDYYFVVADLVTDGGHPSPGVGGYFLLNDRHSTLELVAKDFYEVMGLEFGQPPPVANFSLQRIGNGQYLAWAVTAKTTYGGCTIELQDVIAVIDGKFESVANLPRLNSNKYASDNLKPDYFEYEFAFAYGGKDSAEEFAPIVMNVNGTRGGKPITGTYLATFDGSQNKYVLPKDRPDDGC
jgi:hypothetical protein